MARIDPPIGYTSWNEYIDEQADLSPDQSIEARRLVKRDIKLGMIAAIDRQAGGDTTAIRYRELNYYSSPGSVSPEIGHPWSIFIPPVNNALLQESGSDLLQETGFKILLSYIDLDLELELMNGNGNIDLMVDIIIPTDLQT